MRTTKIQRIIAFLLAVLLLVCGTFSISAAKDENADSELSKIRELLNAISYNEYQNLEEYLEADDATEEISISGLDGVYTNAAGAVVNTADAPASEDEDPVPYKYTADGTDGLFIPASGTVTWTTDKVPTALKYNIQIEYYPAVNKSASIERILLVNGEVPFAEARYLSISKVWTTPHPYAELEATKDVSLEDLSAEAEAAGIKVIGVAEKKVDEKTKINVLQLSIPEVWNESTAKFVDKYQVRYFRADIDKNEIRESLKQTPTWQTYTLKDSNGFTQKPFVFVLTPDDNGNVVISLEGVNEPIVISEIKLVPCVTYQTYDQYKAKYEGVANGTGEIKIEGEYFSAVSDQTIYPTSDTTSAATSPSATDRTLINVVGGEKWQGVGQWMEYKFTVSESGMYDLAMRYKQNILDGMAVSRSLYLYSGANTKTGEELAKDSLGYYDGIPFDEASALKFNFSDNWQMASFTDGNQDFKFYFEKDVVYTMRLEVSLGTMGDIVRRVQESLDAINADYLNILKITGTSPDEFRTYNFYRTLPDTMGDMYEQHEELLAISDILTQDASTKSSMTATLVNVSDLLKEMSSDEDEVAKNLEQLKTYIGSLGTWLGDAKTQPLLIDYILIQSPDAELPKAEAGFFQALWHEISGFFQSFFRNYDRMGSMAEIEGQETEKIEVWLAYGRDQSQVIRNLITNDFTSDPEGKIGKNIAVDLKLVAGGTLLPSILSGQGPDVYLGLGAGDVINYAIRGALESIDEMPGFEDDESTGVKGIRSEFNEEAMMVLEIECAGTNGDAEAHQNCGNGQLHCYGLPETQSFSMMFVREDILAELDLEVPKTWDDVKEAIPVLQANNMEIAMSTDSNIFIYQMGGDLFADNGMRINLDSYLALTAFETMCELFTMYSFPYQYNFANRFRTGEMPIGFADYTGTYNHLKVFATEIEGLWSFYPLPGIEDEDGNINNDAVSGVSAVVMISGTEDEEKKNAWEFMKWYVGTDCQTDYSNEMVAILGPSAKHATANRTALKSLPWTREEYEQIEKQFNNLAAIPNYPGAYIVGRYTGFAFLDAYNDNLDPVASLLGYIDYINDEITRKRDEFSLETLDKTKKQSTLAIKRMQQAEEALNEAMSDNRYSSNYEATCNAVLKELRDYDTKDHGALETLAAQLEAYNIDLFGTAAGYLKQAAACLKSYEAYN